MTSAVSQKGQTVSEAGGMAARFSFREGSLGVRARCIRTSNAPIAAPTRSIHKVISISGCSGAALKSAAKTKSTTKPAHLKPRRVPR
jgi:hypothetical protein